jgi:hypothetical protein
MNEPIVMTMSHRLGREEARRRLEGGFAGMLGSLPGGSLLRLEQRWTGDRLDFSAKGMGQQVTGRVDVLDDAVRVELVLPPFLASLAERFRDTLASAGQRLLGPK